MLSWLVSITLAVATVGPGELLSNPEAQAKLAEAQAAFEEEDYAAAARAIEAAYLIEPKDALLYPWAQAERQRGNCDAAVELYQRFIESDPGPDFVEAAQQNIDRCEEESAADEDMVVLDDEEDDFAGGAVVGAEDDTDDFLGDDTEEDVAEEPLPEPDPAPVAAPTKTDDEPKAKKWYADPLGGVLVGVGVVGIGVGAGLLGVASSSAGKVDDEESNEDYLAARDRATGLRNGGVAALSVGGALLLGGIIRYAVVAKKNKQRESASAATRLRVDSFGLAGVSISGRF